MIENQVDLPADYVDQCLAAAFIRDMQEFDAVVQLKQLAGQVGGAAGAGRCHGQRAAALPGESDQFAQVVERERRMRHQQQGGIVELGGLDAIAFTGGIGENSPATRAAVVAGLKDLNIEIDNTANHAAATGERRIESSRSRVAIWVTPTNEELIVARQTRNFLTLAS